MPPYIEKNVRFWKRNLKRTPQPTWKSFSRKSNLNSSFKLIRHCMGPDNRGARRAKTWLLNSSLRLATWFQLKKNLFCNINWSCSPLIQLNYVIIYYIELQSLFWVGVSVRSSHYEAFCVLHMFFHSLINHYSLLKFVTKSLKDTW